MKKCRSAQRLLVKRLTATSKEWKDIAKETKRQFVTKDRQTMSPQAIQQQRLKSFYESRNASMVMPNGQPLMLNDHDKPNNYAYPPYAFSTRNLVSVHKIKDWAVPPCSSLINTSPATNEP